MTLDVQVDEQQREQRRQAAKRQATHKITWSSRSSQDGDVLLIHTGYEIRTLDGTPVDFVDASEWSTTDEIVADLLAGGYNALRFGFVQAINDSITGDEDACDTDGRTNLIDDGEGYDGHCGNCADRYEAADTNTRS